MEPNKIRSINGMLHLKYNYPHKIYTADVYPRTAPNGSEIVICGHEHGVLILWRGGQAERTYKRNGKPKEHLFTQDVMVVDTSSEDGEEHEPETLPDSEKRAPDSVHPYPSIIQRLDLPLGTAVLDLAFPHISQTEQQLQVPLSPPLLEKELVVALTCADSSVRLLSLPLIPPATEPDSSSALRIDTDDTYRPISSERLLTIFSNQGPHSIPGGVSIAFARRTDSTTKQDTDGQEDLDDASESWDALIVSHSEDLSGILMVHRLSVAKNGLSIEAPPPEGCLWQTQNLFTPPISAKIRAPSSSQDLKSPQILVAGANGTLRVFECGRDAGHGRGFWSLTLYPRCTSPHDLATSQPIILGADWALEGKAIIALLSDGQWGLWDVSTKEIAKLVSGSSPTNFTISEWIGTPPFKSTKKPSILQTNSRFRMMPMTPDTRRVRQDAWFSGQPNQALCCKTGGIRVRPSRRSANGKYVDDVVSIWYGDQVSVIPSLRTHWRNKLKNSENGFGDSSGIQARRFDNIDLLGAQCRGVSVFQRTETSSALKATQADLLVAGERGFLLTAMPLQTRQAMPDPQTSMKHLGGSDLLLDNGDLNVEGLDNALNSMAEMGSVQSMSLLHDKQRINK